MQYLFVKNYGDRVCPRYSIDIHQSATGKDYLRQEAYWYRSRSEAIEEARQIAGLMTAEGHPTTFVERVL